MRRRSRSRKGRKCQHLRASHSKSTESYWKVELSPFVVVKGRRWVLWSVHLAIIDQVDPVLCGRFILTCVRCAAARACWSNIWATPVHRKRAAVIIVLTLYSVIHIRLSCVVDCLTFIICVPSRVMSSFTNLLKSGKMARCDIWLKSRAIISHLVGFRCNPFFLMHQWSFAHRQQPASKWRTYNRCLFG